MQGKIIHYGADEYYRLRTLREAGFTVESCRSLSQFRWVLSSAGRVDAVAFTEAIGRTPRTAMSLARGKRSPLVLFQGWIPHYEESEFNLVVPARTSADQWIDDIDGLIKRTRRLIQDSQEVQTISRILCEEIAAIKERTVLEFRRSKRERERNRGFKVDFLAHEGNSSGLGIVSGSNGFLGSLGAEALHEFRSLMSRSSYAAGAVLFTQGQWGGEIHVIFSGNVKLSVNSSDGKRFIVHIANPGEMLGLASAFTCLPQAATAEACYPCELGSVSSADFLHFLVKHPQTFRAAANELGRAYNQACARLQTLGTSTTVMAKMAGLLLEWSRNGNETERGTQIHIALTQEEMGQCIGIARESVTRILHHLEERQIIDCKGSMLTILDRAALEVCAGER